MQAIPVIDLMGGEVVRARMGDRASYRPIESPLSPTSDPVDVVRGLLSVYPFARSMPPISTRSSATATISPRCAAFGQSSRRCRSGSTTARRTRGGRGSHRRRSGRAGHRQRIPTRQRADRAASGLEAGRAFARFSRRHVSGSAGDPGRTGALAAPHHRHDARASRQRRGPDLKRFAAIRSIAGGARNLCRGRACATRPISQRSRPQAPRAP